MKPEPHPETRIARAGMESDGAHGAVVPPLYLSSNFTFDGLGGEREYEYTRTANPTRTVLARALADLEGAAGAEITNTGMSAITLALQLVPTGRVVVAPADGYGGTWRLLDALAARDLLAVRWVDMGEPAALAAALDDRVAVVWVETPSNPLLRITDLDRVVERTRALAPDALLVADNTFLTPLRQRPLDHGLDLVVHSTTKYLNGHGDVVGGAVLARTDELQERLAWWGNCLGLTGAPFDSYLTLRGLHTLPVRLERQERTAAALARFLAAHPGVQRVHYPGLPDHPDHDLARRQQQGFGAMLSFETRGDRDGVARLVEGLRHFSLAGSLGGVESLIAHPATMTHAGMTAEARRRAGIKDTLLRISVGLEAAADLEADLAGGLERCAGEGAR